jgi:chaperonin cofactor prefoldin
MSEAEQNKYINQLRRQLVNAVERIKTLELDLEPEGPITAAFEAMERPITEKFAAVDEKFAAVDEKFAAIDKRFDRLEHQFNRLQAKIEVVLEAITGLGDLPEDESL